MGAFARFRTETIVRLSEPIHDLVNWDSEGHMMDLIGPTNSPYRRVYGRQQHRRLEDVSQQLQCIVTEIGIGYRCSAAD